MATCRVGIHYKLPHHAVVFVAKDMAMIHIRHVGVGKVYRGTVLRQAAVFGARKLVSDDPTERTDDRVVEVVVSADNAPFLIGQRVLVKFMRGGVQTLAAR